MITRLVLCALLRTNCDDPYSGDSSWKHPESHGTGGPLSPTQEWKWFLAPSLKQTPAGTGDLLFGREGEGEGQDQSPLLKNKTNYKNLNTKKNYIQTHYYLVMREYQKRQRSKNKPRARVKTIL